jgi:hypothetical protein
MIVPRRSGPLVLIAVLLGTHIAQAKTTRTMRYSFDQVFPAAVRFLRIDEGCTIVEKDADAGYVVFELRDDGRAFQGSLEAIRLRDPEGAPITKVVVRLQDRPDYMEQGLVDRLADKLHEDFGAPRPPPPKPTKPRKPKESSAPEPSREP